MDYLLKKGEVVCFVAGKAMEAVTVTRGRVWLTKHADPVDYCLESGDRLCLGTVGRVVVEALDEAAVSVQWREAGAPFRITLSVPRQSLAAQR